MYLAFFLFFITFGRFAISVANAARFAGKMTEFGTRMTALKPPVAAFLAIHNVMRKSVKYIRSMSGL